MRVVPLVLLSSLGICSGELVKVVVLARHGNRAPNSQLTTVCPNCMPLADKFHEPIDAKMKAALSKGGMSEMGQAGRFLKDRYRNSPDVTDKLLKDGPYFDDGETFFLSERMNRNINSVQLITDTMYPRGSGQKGFREDNPNFVPITTTTPFRDTVMNLPRDGPCHDAYNYDREVWNEEHEAAWIAENRELIDKFSAICGFDFATARPGGKAMIWGLKAATDFFGFAQSEGIDTTGMKNYDQKVIDEVTKITKANVNSQRFGKRHQLVYWAGNFLTEALFPNLKEPAANEKKETLDLPGLKLSKSAEWMQGPREYFENNKFLLLLNHRELIASITQILEMEYLLEHPVATGGMLIWELHKEDGEYFLKQFAWAPEKPAFDKLNAVITELDGPTGPVAKHNMNDMYMDSLGTLTPLSPNVCTVKGKCTVEDLERAYDNIVKEEGTWEEVCKKGANLRKKAKKAAKHHELEYMLDYDQSGDLVPMEPMTKEQMALLEASRNAVVMGGKVDTLRESNFSDTISDLLTLSNMTFLCMGIVLQAFISRVVNGGGLFSQTRRGADSLLSGESVETGPVYNRI